MTYPQRTLALLQVRTCSLPASTEVLHEILLKVRDIEPTWVALLFSAGLSRHFSMSILNQS